MQTNRPSTNLWKMGGWMALTCVVPLLALAAIFAFNIPLSTVALFGIVLICPAIHLLMMRNHGHAGHTNERPDA